MIENELVTDMWKRRMKETLQMVYNNQLNDKILEEMLDLEIAKSMSQGTRYAYMRDIYRSQTIKLDLNEIMIWIYEKRLIVGANGAYTYSPEDVLGDTSIMVMGDMESRAREKKLAKDFEKKGFIKESVLHDNLQTKFKQDTNSTYGIACMPGSFLFSPDSATYITTQARQLISEMLWSFERFLVNNLQLTSFNEALLYVNSALAEPRHWNDYKQYIDYIPTTKDVIRYLLSKFTDIPNFNSETKEIARSLFIFMKHLTEEERVYLYYKFNFINLISKNPKIMNIFKNIANQMEPFINPYSIPECYKPYCDELISVCKEFSYGEFMVTHRVDKYFTSTRETILLSDTDSVFIILGQIKDLIYKNIGQMYRYKSNNYKIINTLCALCTHYIEMRHDKFVSACNIKYKFDKYKLEAKNEFYYKRIIIYTGIKKNYSGLKLLREGNIVPPEKQISHTGIKLTGSRIPTQVSDFQTRLIEDNILRAEVIDPVKVMLEIDKERELIKSIIKSGDKSMGIPQRFSGYNKYKAFESIQVCRLVTIWNRIYPEQKIGNGEYLMTFETRIRNENDLRLVQDIDMREKLRKAVFSDKYDGEDNFLKRHGLTSIAIPRDGAVTTIPQWAIDIIDYDLMARKHLQAIIDLLPSLSLNKVKTKDFSTYSPLLRH